MIQNTCNEPPSYDNIMVKLLPEPKDLFKNGILSEFVVKIGDFGQAGRRSQGMGFR